MPLRFTLILLGLVALAGGVAYLFLSRTSPSVSEWTYQPVVDTGSTYIALEEKKRTQAIRDIALYNRANETKDITLCAEITTPDDQLKCRDTVMTALALDAQDLSKCQSISLT
jgi:hypothetical protein